jgi:poly(3-hydroxybutyrate) depolymerase
MIKVLFLSLLLALKPAPIPAGSSKVEVEANGHRIELYTYKPKGYTDGPLIVVFHGMLRNADEYRDQARGMGDRFGALIVAPRIDAKRFPNEAYQQGGLFRDGKAQPRERWTWSLVPKIVAEVRRREGRPDMPLYLIGHSAGGQFLSRLAAFVPTGARRIVVANPSSHLFPTRDLPFHYGFGKVPEELSNDEALKRYLAQPVTIYLGTADRLNEYLDRSSTARKQGANRYERGQNAFEKARKLAQEKGWKFGWRLVEAPKVGHDAKAMFDNQKVAEALFGKKR